MMMMMLILLVEHTLKSVLFSLWIQINVYPDFSQASTIGRWRVQGISSYPVPIFFFTRVQSG